jgi:hypothetical protein
MKKIIEHLRAEWFKYLLEILVITIGILGAFTLNNWNEGRKDTNREIKFYNELLSDLQVNRREIAELRAELLVNIKSVDGIHTYLSTQKPEDDSLKAYFEGLHSIGIFNSPNSAYQNMQNSGAFELSNDSLRLRITAMYERHFFNIHFRNNKQWEMLDQHLKPFMNKNFMQTEPMLSASFVFLNKAVDYPQLCQNIEFQNMYLNLKSWCILRFRWISETESELDLLIEEVKSEINRLSN